jgi:CoA:oxalate CoA-transferase
MTDREHIQGPLNEIVVLELAQVLAGPTCAHILYELGARVIKIEPPSGDSSRSWPLRDPHGVATYFRPNNAGKESIVLDLKKPQDREIFLKLVQHADIVVEANRPGVLEQLGLSYKVLQKVNPRLILASISGYGQEGPRSTEAAFATSIAAISGELDSAKGSSGGNPRIGSFSIADILGGLYAVIGIQAALWEREKTGKGNHIDLSLFEVDLRMQWYQVAQATAHGGVFYPDGLDLTLAAPFGIFATKDRYISLAAGTDSLFQPLLVTLELSHLQKDPRFQDASSRLQNVKALRSEIENVLIQQTSEFWIQKLTEAGVPCTPVNTVPQAIQDPQIKFRGSVVPLEGTEVFRPVLPFIFRDGGLQRPTHYPDAPALDENKAKILSDLESECLKNPGRFRSIIASLLYKIQNFELDRWNRDRV